MGDNRKSSKKKRPISRKFWNYLRLFPKPLQAKVIRSKFEIDYNLPEDLILKQAETESEMQQALNLVHDSYVELGYIDRQESEMRFSKFHALPTAVILVAKQGDEVIGTISILPDSAFGLPSEATWSLDKYRQNGNILAEVSSLAIKKCHRTRRGKLLLPLCKIMIEYAMKILKVDGLVIATTHEVEPFYVHVLLFETVVKKTGQRHGLVKGNPSSCCYLPVGDTLPERFAKVYKNEPLNKNLGRFFFEAELSNIRLPEPKKSLQAFHKNKNFAKSLLIKKYPDMTQSFTEKDKLILSNLDAGGFLSIQPDQMIMREKKSIRCDTRFKVWVFFEGSFTPIDAQMLDVSEHGFQLKLRNPHPIPSVGAGLSVVLENRDKLILARAVVRWVRQESRSGCEIVEFSNDWINWVQGINSEIFHNRKIEIKKVG